MTTARRGRREPTVERRTHTRVDGSMSEVWSVRYWDTHGQRRRKGCRSREHAEYERARLALEATAPPDEDSDTGAVVLGAFWPVWVADARSRLQPETVDGLERLFEARVRPRFGETELRRIRPRMVAQWRAELLAGGTGVETVRRTMNLLQAVFTVAVEWGEATTNPVSVVRKPKQGRKRAVEPRTPEEVEAIRAVLLAAGRVRSATMVSVLAYSGLRPGEMLGLEIRHVRDRTLLVEQAVAHGRLKVQKTGRAYRTVDLFDVLRGDLRAWIEQVGEEPDTLLFARKDGSPWRLDDWTNWRNRHFHEATRTVGLGTPRPYDLRHSFASLLIREQRVSIVDLADMLGHAPTMTLDTYSHVMREHRGQPPVAAETWITTARRRASAAPGQAATPPS